MKVALCLYGNVGNSECASQRTHTNLMRESEEASMDAGIAHASFSRNLIQMYDTDVFIHSWSTKAEKYLERLYRPVRSEILTQKEFSDDISSFGISEENDNIDEWDISENAKIGYKNLLPSRESVSEIREEMRREAFRARSRWWSSKRTLELKKEFEDEHKFKYDFVVVSRMDCIIVEKISLENRDPKKFYATFRKNSGGVRREDYDHAVQDFFFISGTENMDKFSSLYDRAEDYCIRPTFSSREHVEKVIGKDNLEPTGYIQDVDYFKVTVTRNG